MEIRKGFYDLCVPFTQNALTVTLEELYEYGYRTVAIEEVFNHAKLKQRTGDIFPEPSNLDELRAKFQNRLQILNRLTIIYGDPAIALAMRTSMNLKRYHVLAGAPINETALQHCCSTFDGDLITLNPEDTKLVLVSHKFYQQATRRGMFFELKYAPAICDSKQRKDMISAGQNLVANKRANSIVFSGGVLNRFQARSPYDIANLGLIFGLSEEQSKSSISNVCRKLLLRAEGRRYGKTVIIARSLNDKQHPQTDEDDDDDEDDSEESEDDDGLDSDESMEEKPAKKAKMEG